MDYGVFKGLQALLFFGAALGFGVWQLITVNREIRKAAEEEQAQTAADAEAASNTDQARKSFDESSTT